MIRFPIPSKKDAKEYEALRVVEALISTETSIQREPTVQAAPVKSTEPPLWRPILFWTIVVEVFTCVMRFGARLESTKDTASTIGRLTFGLRIHHSYVGAAIALIALLLFGPVNFFFTAYGLCLFV